MVATFTGTAILQITVFLLSRVDPQTYGKANK